MVNKTLHILFFCLLFLGSTTLSAEVKLYTEVEPQSGTLIDDFVFRIVVESENEAPYPLPVGGEDFQLTFVGPQSSIEIVNGRVSSKQVYIYRMTAKKVGTLKSPQAELEVNGKKLLSDPISVEVKAAALDIPKPGGPIFFKQGVEADKIYVGQQIPYFLDIYTQLALLQPSVDDLTFDGFWQEDFGKNQNFMRQFEGEQYQVVRVRKALFALRSGSLTIPSRTLKALVHEKNQRRNPSPFDRLDPFSEDIFDRFFGTYQTKEIKLTSNPLTIQVSELPEAPADFPIWNLSSALVGQSEVELRANKIEAKVGESLNFDLTVKSYGNLNPLKDIPLQSNSQYKIYTETPEMQRFDKDEKLRSVKHFKFTLVPLMPGKIDLAPVKLGYFNLENSSYEVAQSQPINILVTGDAAAGVPEVKSTMPALMQTAAPSPTSVNAVPTPALYQEAGKTEKFLNLFSIRMVLLLLIVFMGFVALVFGAYAFNLHTRPQRQLIKAISSAQTLSELNQILTSYLQKRLKLEAGALREEFYAKLKQHYSEADLLFELGNILSNLEVNMYSNLAVDLAQIAALRARILRIAKAL